MKKHYPNTAVIRQQARQVSRAIEKLAGLGVDIMTVRFRHPNPLIEVNHCPGTAQIKNALKGQGRDGNGRYYKRVAVVHGCQIEWREEVL